MAVASGKIWRIAWPVKVEEESCCYMGVNVIVGSSDDLGPMIGYGLLEVASLLFLMQVWEVALSFATVIVLVIVIVLVLVGLIVIAFWSNLLSLAEVEMLMTSC
jgi:hypothetical protein